MTTRQPLLDPGLRAAILRRVGELTVDDLHALDAAVRALREAKAHKHVDKGYGYAWWEGSRLDGDGEAQLDELFSDVVAALATGLTGLDVERIAARFAPRASMLDGLARFFARPRPKRQVQDAAIGLIDDAVAPWDPRLAVVATWNMACAAALRDHLSATTQASLEAAWRQGLGDPPA